MGSCADVCLGDGLVRLRQLLPTLEADVVVRIEETNDVRGPVYTFSRSIDSFTGMIDAVLGAPVAEHLESV